MFKTNLDLSTPRGRHNAIVLGLTVLIGPGLIVAAAFIVQRAHNHTEAVELSESGLMDLGNGKIEEGLSKLELAEAKQASIVWDRTLNYPSVEEVDLQSLKPEEKLIRLKGIKVVRPGESWVDEQLRECYESGGALEQLQSMHEQTLELWQDSKAIVAVDEPSVPELSYAKQLWQRGKREETLRALSRVSALYPWHAEARKFASEVYDSMGLQEQWKRFDGNNLSEGDLRQLQDLKNLNYNGADQKSALQRLESVIRNNPRCAVALLLRADRYADTNEYSKALADANLLVQLYPDLAEAYLLRARIRLNRNDAALAVQDLSRAHELMPDSRQIIEARVNAALGLDEAKYQELVVRDYRWLVNHEGIDGAEVRIKLASYLARLGRYKEADAAIDDGIPAARNKDRIAKLTAGPGGYTPHDARDLKLKKVDLRIDQKDYSTALNILSELLRAEPEELSLYDAKAECLMASGRKQEALDAINIAISKQGPPYYLNGTWLGPRSDVLPERLPAGSYLKLEALQRIEKRATIYDAMGDKEGALSDQKMRLKIIVLYSELEQNSSCFEAIELAEQINDAPSAVRAVKAFRKSPDCAGLCRIDEVCVKLQTSPNVEFARAVVQEFANRFPERPRVRDALKSLKQV